MKDTEVEEKSCRITIITIKHLLPSLTCTESGHQCGEAGEAQEDAGRDGEEKQVERAGRQREQPVTEARVEN